MGIRLEKLSPIHGEDLFAFELENKEYFKRMGFPRPEGYYIKKSFMNTLNELTDETGTLLFLIYVGRDLVGRINISDIEETEKGKIGEVGYRIGENHGKKGIATKALSLLKKQADEEYQFDTLLAKTIVDYYVSQVVLIKNQFQFVEKIKYRVYENGPKEDFVLFRCDLR